MSNAPANSQAIFDLTKLDLNDGPNKRKTVTAKATASKYQERRRKEALLKQQQARDDNIHRARALALQTANEQVWIWQQQTEETLIHLYIDIWWQ